MFRVAAGRLLGVQAHEQHKDNPYEHQAVVLQGHPEEQTNGYVSKQGMHTGHAQLQHPVTASRASALRAPAPSASAPSASAPSASAPSVSAPSASAPNASATKASAPKASAPVDGDALFQQCVSSVSGAEREDSEEKTASLPPMEHNSKQQAPRKQSKRLSSQVEDEYKKLVKLTKMNCKLELAHAKKLHAMKLEHFSWVGAHIGRLCTHLVDVEDETTTDQQMLSKLLQSVDNLSQVQFRNLLPRASDWNMLQRSR